MLLIAAMVGTVAASMETVLPAKADAGGGVDTLIAAPTCQADLASLAASPASSASEPQLRSDCATTSAGAVLGYLGAAATSALAQLPQTDGLTSIEADTTALVTALQGGACGASFDAWASGQAPLCTAAVSPSFADFQGTCDVGLFPRWVPYDVVETACIVLAPLAAVAAIAGGAVGVGVFVGANVSCAVHAYGTLETPYIDAVVGSVNGEDTSVGESECVSLTAQPFTMCLTVQTQYLTAGTWATLNQTITCQPALGALITVSAAAAPLQSIYPATSPFLNTWHRAYASVTTNVGTPTLNAASAPWFMPAI